VEKVSVEVCRIWKFNFLFKQAGLSKKPNLSLSRMFLAGVYSAKRIGCLRRQGFAESR
jgi:hypothetical protein